MSHRNSVVNSQPMEDKSPTPSSDYTTSDDEEGSRDSLDFSSMRILDNESSMGGGVGPGPNGAATNFARMHGQQQQLSCSLPSTSVDDGTTGDARENNASIAGRKRTFSNSAEPQDGNNGTCEKRTATKICRVCGDKAYSYNFNVITCESCKAFFRRNANKEKEIRCPFNDQCDINIVSRRFCQRCRLQKCFRVGMKKEWIMSEEARLEKKQRILDNRERRAAERVHDDKTNNVVTQEDIAAAIAGSPSLVAAATAPGAITASTNAAAAAVAALLPAAVVANPFTTPTAAGLLGTAPQATPAATAEVAQLAAAVAQVAAAHAPQTLPATTFPPQNDPQQLATERALAASIVANASNPGPATNSGASFVTHHHQQQIVNQLAQVQQIQQAQLEHQIQQAQAVQQMAVQAAVQAQTAQMIQQQQVHQQHQAQQQQQQQQLAAAVVAAAAASTMVPSAPPSGGSVVAVPAMATTLPTASSISTPSATATDTHDLITVPRDMLLKLVKMEVDQAQQHNPLNHTGAPPVKCQCRCQCGRYPTDLLIVDKVMTDLLESSSKYNNSRSMSQLSPKNDPPSLMSTSPPGVSAPFMSHAPAATVTMPPPTMAPLVHQSMASLSTAATMASFQPMCSGVAPISTAGMPMPMEEDFVYKSIRTAAC